MSLKETLEGRLKDSMKSKDQFISDVLRLLLSSIQNKEIEARAKGGELSDEDVLGVLQSEAKKRKESIKVFKEGNRNDLAEKEEKELKVIEEYLPTLMSEEETKKAVEKILEGGGVSDFGSAMKAVMGELKGQADAKLISQIVKEHFGS